jgi:hypothetical protein
MFNLKKNTFLLFILSPILLFLTDCADYTTSDFWLKRLLASSHYQKASDNHIELDKLVFSIINHATSYRVDPVFSSRSLLPTSYPILEKLFMDIECEGRRPGFSVVTGLTIPKALSPKIIEQQLNVYMQASRRFSNPIYFSIPRLTHMDFGENLNPKEEFVSSSLYSPALVAATDKLFSRNIPQPSYYVLHFSHKFQHWNMKMIFVSPQFWTKSQAIWLEHVLEEKNTYTFIVYSSDDPFHYVEDILKTQDYTLAFKLTQEHYMFDPHKKTLNLGHFIGDAPFGKKHIGYTFIRQHSDLNLEILTYDLESRGIVHQAAIQPNGRPAMLQEWWN